MVGHFITYLIVPPHRPCFKCQTLYKPSGTFTDTIEKIMRQNFILVTAALLFAAVSCKQNELSKEETDPVLDEQGVAVEILADYHLTSYDRLIDVNSDSDFIDSDVESAMTKSPNYRNSCATKADSDTPDTLKFSEMIPFCADIKETTLIYQNGNSEYIRLTDLNSEINPLLSLHDSELDLTLCVAKFEMKDGRACTYNNRGEIISEMEVEMPDYSEFLDEMAKVQEESAAGTKSGTKKRDINWLKQKMAEQYPTKSGADDSYTIYEKDGKVVLEQNVPETKSGEGYTTVRTYLSSDISKNYGYEQLENGRLKVRCTHYYDLFNSSSTKSTNVPVEGISEDNPNRIVVEELSYLNDETPIIKVSDKKYSVNTIHYNVKR